MRTLELKTAAWTAAIPARWKDFEVQFSNDAAAGFANYAGSKFMALSGSQLRGSGAEVEALFDGLIHSNMAVELIAKKAETPKVKVEEAPKVELKDAPKAETPKKLE